MKFYPADWRADAMLRLCCIAARGLWAEMMCIMHEAERYGSLLVNGKRIDKKQLAGLAGISERECTALLLELEGNGVFSRDGDGTIYSRRMRRDFEKAAKDKENGKAGGHPDIRRGTVPKDERVRRFRRSDAPEKAKRIFARSDGNCHWCQNPLDPEHYHIDHVVAVRDGGTNEETNLVASCPHCNGERAMTWGRNYSDLKVGNTSDHKAQKPEARSQLTGGGGDARAREPIPKQPWELEPCHDLARQLAEIAKTSDEFEFTGWGGATYRVKTWLSEGWPAELILAAFREASGKPGYIPPHGIKYFEPIVARFIAQQQTPLPTIVEIPAKTVEVSHGSSSGNSASAAARRLEISIQQQLAEDGLDNQPYQPTYLRVQEG